LNQVPRLLLLAYLAGKMKAKKGGEAVKESDIIKSGTVLKEGGAPLKMRWQQRYLIITAGTAYYDKRKPSEGQPITYGSIPNLSKCTVAHFLEAGAYKYKSSAQQRSMHII